MKKGEQKKVSQISIIDECLQKGGMDTEKIAQEVLKIFPSKESKKVRSLVSVRVWNLKRKGIEIIRNENGTYGPKKKQK